MAYFVEPIRYVVFDLRRPAGNDRPAGVDAHLTAGQPVRHVSPLGAA
jgi:hypothetical protein